MQAEPAPAASPLPASDINLNTPDVSDTPVKRKEAEVKHAPQQQQQHHVSALCGHDMSSARPLTAPAQEDELTERNVVFMGCDVQQGRAKVRWHGLPCSPEAARGKIGQFVPTN